MAQYRKKSVVIEAVRYLGAGNMEGEVPDWIWEGFDSAVLRSTDGTDPLVIKTLEGERVASPGDWIIKGVKGELDTCKPDIFEATYESVENQPELPGTEED